MATKAKFDVAKLPFNEGFKPKNIRLIAEKGPGKLICAWDDEWNGKPMFNIREIYELYNTWRPSKAGFSVPAEHKSLVLENLSLCK
jgi:hypothetical protein